LEDSPLAASASLKVWDGRANLVKLPADGPTGHIAACPCVSTIRNPVNGASISPTVKAALGQPAIGEFKYGRGEFFDQESFNGRAILVRFVISDISPNSCRFEQAFSEDGGKAGK
jgi:hypothetical protein